MINKFSNGGTRLVEARKNRKNIAFSNFPCYHRRSMAETYKSMAELAAAVDAHDGIMTLPMWKVRDAFGAGRLGVNVCVEIASALEKHGLQHRPETIPSDQMQQIRLWKTKGAVARLMRAARRMGDDYDQELRDAANAKARATVEKIRALVNA